MGVRLTDPADPTRHLRRRAPVPPVIVHVTRLSPLLGAVRTPRVVSTWFCRHRRAARHCPACAAERSGVVMDQITDLNRLIVHYASDPGDAERMAVAAGYARHRDLLALGRALASPDVPERVRAYVEGQVAAMTELLAGGGR